MAKTISKQTVEISPEQYIEVIGRILSRMNPKERATLVYSLFRRDESEKEKQSKMLNVIANKTVNSPRAHVVYG